MEITSNGRSKVRISIIFLMLAAFFSMPAPILNAGTMGNSTPEICDGIDNDLDGLVDNNPDCTGAAN